MLCSAATTAVGGPGFALGQPSGGPTGSPLASASLTQGLPYLRINNQTAAAFAIGTTADVLGRLLINSVAPLLFPIDGSLLLQQLPPSPAGRR